jgi:hypothetical protein
MAKNGDCSALINSKTKVVSSLKDYLGVSTLNVAGEVKFLTPLLNATV